MVNYVKTPVVNPLAIWLKWVYNLPYTEQEFMLLGLANVKFCVQFEFKPYSHPNFYENIKQHNVQFQAYNGAHILPKLGLP